MPAHLFQGLLGKITDPGKIFLETSDGSILTYGALLEATARFAHALTAQDLKPGDRLAVQVEKSPEAIILYLAAARAGVVFLPLNPAYTVAELDYFIADAEPALVIVDPPARAIDPSRRRAAPLETGRPGWGASSSAPAARRRNSPMPSGSRTISRHCSTPPAPPGAPRGPC
jgi:malonyl-CoA/methylmalonyl-CoA synthetase